MANRLFLTVFSLLALLGRGACIEAKTTVSLEGTTITFTVPVVIFIPVEAEPLDQEKKKKLIRGLKGMAYDSEKADESLARLGDRGQNHYRKCYRIKIDVQPSIRFESIDGKPGRIDHALAYSPSQKSEQVN